MRELPVRAKGHAVGLSTVATLLAAVAAWFAWVPVNSVAIAPGANVFAVLLDNFLAAMFVSGLVGTVIGMIPLQFLPGWTLKAWRRGAWLLAFAGSFFILVQVMLRPHGTRTSAVPLAATITLLIVFGGLSIAFREFFARRRRRATGVAPPPFRERVRELLSAKPALRDAVVLEPPAD